MAINSHEPLLAGMLLDLSGSMAAVLQLNDRLNQDNVTRAHSIFTTISNIVKEDLELQGRQEVFALAFGLKEQSTYL
jgi:hypothetical protein